MIASSLRMMVISARINVELRENADRTGPAADRQRQMLAAGHVAELPTRSPATA
jgi:hypothetical protein